ncbi:YndJ family transporter [Cellulosimicrobium protaetiae]|uniref:YndJ family transporter n=2 Tax=Cellulosimicrobium protaetiae TaxID=2587808 RepID=A0A6M5UM60_9MICO|nr:YndJ family transporter [Cellulosimicrobium protaetiae]
MVVVLPLGLRLLGPDVVPAPRSAAWPLAGVAGAAGVVLPHGTASVLLALVFAAATAVLAGAGARLAARTLREVRARRATRADRSAVARLASRAATVTALVMPAVGASALVAERAGWGLLGFSGTYLALTVPHMLYAGFGAALIAGAVARLGTDRLAVAGAWGVPLGTVLVLVGYFVGDVAELVGAGVLTLALWATAVATVRSFARPTGPAEPGGAQPDGRRPGDDRREPADRRLPDGRGDTAVARVLLGTGATLVGPSMLLALWWAAGEALGFAHPSLDVMAATHGVANALGFVLCTILGLRILARGPSASDEADGAGRGTSRGPGRAPEGSRS